MATKLSLEYAEMECNVVCFGVGAPITLEKSGHGEGTWASVAWASSLSRTGKKSTSRAKGGEARGLPTLFFWR